MLARLYFMLLIYMMDQNYINSTVKVIAHLLLGLPRLNSLKFSCYGHCI